MKTFIITSILVVCSFLLHKAVFALTVSPLIVDFEANPQETVSDSVAIFNETQEPISVVLSVENFIPGDNNGEVIYTQSPLPEQRDFLKWFFVQDDSAVLQPGQSLKIPYSIGIPQNAKPGTYYAALVWQKAAIGAAQQNTLSKINIAERIATLVFLNVSGSEVSDVRITQFSPSQQKLWYSHVPKEYITTLENTGNSYIKPTGGIKITNMFGGSKALFVFNQNQQRVVPSTQRVFTTDFVREPNTFIFLLDFFPGLRDEVQYLGFGKYTAQLQMEGEVFKDAEVPNISIFVIPWRILSLFGLFLILIFVLWRIRKKRKKIMINDSS